MNKAVAAAVALIAASCGGGSDNVSQQAGLEPEVPAAEIAVVGIDDLAERYVKLALALAEHDPAYVDAYFGPEEWARAAKSEKRSLDALEADADDILEALGILKGDGVTVRESALARNVTAAKTRIRMTRGEKLSFDEEAKLLYGVTPPSYSFADFDAALSAIETLLPGSGDLASRMEAFKNRLEIPEEKRQTVFDAAIAECRRRTLAHFELPPNERFIMRFVTGKPWSGYNWYQSKFESLIEINTDLPIIMDRAVDLGCHEGYPGHHVWNVFVERDLRLTNDWIEFSVYPLFSPQALLAEGSANYGIELAFPADEKTVFEKDVLFPIAGFNPEDAEKLSAINRAQRKLSHAGNHVAREYLDGRIDRETAIGLLMKYSLTSRERSEQRVRFFETYRSYVINYNLGRDLVESYIAKEAAKGVDPWAAFQSLLKNPDAISVLAPA